MTDPLPMATPPPKHAVDLDVAFALPPNEAQALFAELASGSFLPVPGKAGWAYGFRGSLDGEAVRLQVVRVTVPGRWKGAFSLHLDGTLRANEPKPRLSGTLWVERDRGTLLVGLAICVAVGALIAWPATPGALIAAATAMAITAALIIVLQLYRESSALAWADELCATLEAVRPISEHAAT